MHKLRKYLTAAAIAASVITPTAAAHADGLKWRSRPLPSSTTAPRYCEVKHGQIINRPPADVGICYGTIFVRGYNVPWWW